MSDKIMSVFDLSRKSLTKTKLSRIVRCVLESFFSGESVFCRHYEGRSSFKNGKWLEPLHYWRLRCVLEFYAKYSQVTVYVPLCWHPVCSQIHPMSPCVDTFQPSEKKNTRGNSRAWGIFSEKNRYIWNIIFHPGRTTPKGWFEAKFNNPQICGKPPN